MEIRDYEGAIRSLECARAPPESSTLGGPTGKFADGLYCSASTCDL